ncbi:MAG: DUF3365 domain-containing protein [Gammaproteobacteria bacterium]|nr:DUF3365 domain-containing protein [Gammaproteobacteria bacterium]
MGIRGKFRLLMAGFFLLIVGFSYYLIEQSNKQLIELEALRIADIISNQVLADRAIYTGKVVQKLKADGTGSDRHSLKKPGFILLPAQFVRAVADKVNEQNKGLYSYYLRSKWNLNKTQGLQDDFDSWAWQGLEAQEKSGQSSGSEWQSMYRFTEINNREVLQYYKADIASAQPCVSCHNAYEQAPDVKAMRVAAGVEPGKQWKLNELMGAIRVEIPINTVKAMANDGRNRLLLSLIILFITGFAAMMIVIIKSIIKPIEGSMEDLNNFSTKIDSVVECSRDLLKTADEQVHIYEAARANKGKASINELTRMADRSAMSAEESAAHCLELKESFAESSGRFAKIIGVKK